MFATVTTNHAPPLMRHAMLAFVIFLGAVSARYSRERKKIRRYFTRLKR